MSPEQALGSQSVDARSDVYGMGAVLFQLLTGAPPFEGNDSQEIVGRHLHEPVPVATPLARPRAALALRASSLRCMAKHPDDRYPTARAVLEALRAGRTGAAADPVACCRGPTSRPPRRCRSRKAASAPRPWMAGAAAAALVGAVLVFSGRRDADGSGGDGSAGSARAIVPPRPAPPSRAPTWWSRTGSPSRSR